MKYIKYIHLININPKCGIILFTVLTWCKINYGRDEV